MVLICTSRSVVSVHNKYILKITLESQVCANIFEIQPQIAGCSEQSLGLHKCVLNIFHLKQDKFARSTLY